MKRERPAIADRWASYGCAAALLASMPGFSQQAPVTNVPDAVTRKTGLRLQPMPRAARIYAEALSTDPAFYRFLRTMDASRAFIQKGTTMVLPADSELFGVLFDGDYYNHAGVPRSAAWNGINARQEENVHP